MCLVEEGEGERRESLVYLFVVGYGSHSVNDVWVVGKVSVGVWERCWWLAVVFVCPPLVVELCEDDLATEKCLEIVVGLVRFVGFVDVKGVEFVRWWPRVSVEGGEGEVGML